MFVGTKVISRLIGLKYENIAKMANKIFNVLNHLIYFKTGCPYA